MSRLARALSCLAAVAAGLSFAPRAEAVLELAQVRRAHESILRLDVEDAKKALAGASPDDRVVARELALLAVYEGDCDAAVLLLARHKGATDVELGGLDEVARGCARATAAVTTVRDEARGIVVRVKDDADLPLAPFLFEVADLARASVEKELGTTLPRPLHIEVVRDQYSLALHTGLPEKAAQTTGTVAVAKWGKVTMVSPRVMPHGYPWADTLAHELTHLAITRATRDRAPLWLQEGVAKREETRWRAPLPMDDVPSPDAMAKLGFERGLALPLDKLGPSIAMLPSGEQAMVAYAEVHSFVRVWSKENGEGSLARLLAGIADATEADPTNAALSKVSGADLSAWAERWQRSLSGVTATVPPELAPGATPKDAKEAHKKARLGDLLAERGHAEAAAPYLARTVELAPHDASARGRLALALRAIGRTEEAARVVASLEAVHGPEGVHFAMRGAAARDRGDAAAAQEAFRWALWTAPFTVVSACEAKDEAPADPARAAICDAARNARRR